MASPRLPVTGVAWCPCCKGAFWRRRCLACVLVLAYGLWLNLHGVWLLRLTAALLFVVDALLLWGNLLPYHYYFSPAAGLNGAGSLARRNRTAFLGQPDCRQNAAAGRVAAGICASPTGLCSHGHGCLCCRPSKR